MKDWKGAERSPWGSVYKGAVRKTRASECQGIHDRLTELALDFADAIEQALFPWNPLLCSSAEGRTEPLSMGLVPGELS